METHWRIFLNRLFPTANPETKFIGSAQQKGGATNALLLTFFLISACFWIHSFTARRGNKVGRGEETEREREKNNNNKNNKKPSTTYIVVPSRPGWVELHVELSLFSGQLIVLGLLLPGQSMPLDKHREENPKTKWGLSRGTFQEETFFDFQHTRWDVCTDC